MRCMSVTAEASHSPMGTLLCCREQSPSLEKSTRQASTAVLRAAWLAKTGDAAALPRTTRSSVSRD